MMILDLFLASTVFIVLEYNHHPNVNILVIKSQDDNYTDWSVPGQGKTGVCLRNPGEAAHDEPSLLLLHNLEEAAIEKFLL